MLNHFFQRLNTSEKVSSHFRVVFVALSSWKRSVAMQLPGSCHGNGAWTSTACISGTDHANKCQHVPKGSSLPSLSDEIIKCCYIRSANRHPEILLSWSLAHHGEHYRQVCFRGNSSDLSVFSPCLNEQLANSEMTPASAIAFLSSKLYNFQFQMSLVALATVHVWKDKTWERLRLSWSELGQEQNETQFIVHAVHHIVYALHRFQGCVFNSGCSAHPVLDLKIRCWKRAHHTPSNTVLACVPLHHYSCLAKTEIEKGKETQTATTGVRTPNTCKANVTMLCGMLSWQVIESGLHYLCREKFLYSILSFCSLFIPQREVDRSWR